MEVTRTGAWLMATRPRTLSAAAAPVVAATGLAFADGVLAALPALAALLGALLIQIATNLANDYYDYMKGGDTGERLGPVRVTAAGILPPRAVRRGMYVALALATLTGAYLVAVAGWPILAIGLASMLMGVCYTGGPYPLSYHGLGDAFVFVFFGPVATMGTYYVQARQWSVDALLVGVGLGAFSTAMLVVNNLRDRETDEAAGKRTLAVRFGDGFSVAQYLGAIAIAAAVPVVGVLAMEWSPWTLLALLAPAPAIWSAMSPVLAVGRAPSRADRRTLNPALGTTARGVALYGVGLGVGATISGLAG